MYICFRYGEADAYSEFVLWKGANKESNNNWLELC